MKTIVNKNPSVSRYDNPKHMDMKTQAYIKPTHTGKQTKTMKAIITCLYTNLDVINKQIQGAAWLQSHYPITAQEGRSRWPIRDQEWEWPEIHAYEMSTIYNY